MEERTVVVAAVSDAGELAVPFGGQPYVALLWATDDRFDGAARMAVAGALIESGCLYIVCGGVDCEQWHDDADTVLALQGADADDSRLVMTTWHTNQAMEEVVFFASFCNDLNEYHDSQHFLLLAIGQPGAKRDEAMAALKTTWELN